MKEKWRIPTLAELSTLVIYGDKVALMTPTIPDGIYWSSTVKWETAAKINYVRYMIQLDSIQISVKIAHDHPYHTKSVIFVKRTDTRNVLNWSKPHHTVTYEQAVQQCNRINSRKIVALQFTTTIEELV